MLTHKAGLASGLAHDHLVTAPLAGLAISLDGESRAATRGSFRVAVADLEIDAAAARRDYAGRLRELGFGPRELPPVADSDRKKVRVAMLGKSQLDAAKFPEIRAELLSFAPVANAADAANTAQAAREFDRVARLKVTLHGKSVERDLVARLVEEGGKLRAEAWGEFRFSEFGIEPYSAAFGAVRNEDAFHLYLALTATIAPKS